MAINPETQYPGKIAPSTSDYPYGSARNITTPGDGTGTPWEAALVNDKFGFEQAAMGEGGEVPTGTPDTATDSQILRGVKRAAQKNTDTIFADEASLAAGTTVDGMAAKFFEGQTVRVKDLNADYVVFTSDDGNSIDLGDGLWARPANKGANFSEFGTAENKSFDIYVKAERVNLLRGVPNSEIAAIRAGTSTFDLSAIVQAAVNYCSSNHARLELPHGQLNFSNILLPSNGIEVVGVHTHGTRILNNSLSTPVFRTAAGARNLWTMLDKFKIVTPNGGTSAINIKSFEHLLLGQLDITTAPAERGSGTSSGILIERDVNTDFGFYLDISEGLKVDKHGYGLRVKGVSGANCNANAIRGLVTNDNTNAGVRLDWCTGLKLVDGSAEINKNNIEIFDSAGCVVRGYYMERPETHNIQIIRGDICQVIGNPILSSAGAGPGFDGSTPDSNGRAVYIDESVGVSVRDNGFFSPWSFYDVQTTASASACEVTDNRKRERVNGFNQYTVEVLDQAGDTIIRNFQKTAGGNVILLDASSARQVVGALETVAGKELIVSQTTAKVYAGNGNPEGVVTADRGSIYLRNDGGGGFSFYVKETGDGLSTGWVSK